MTPPLPWFCRSFFRTLLALGCLGATGAWVSAGETEWPQFRGPTGEGVSHAANVPVKWSATEGVVWSVEVPGSGWSSPVLSKGRLYLTSAEKDATSGDVTLHALCLDAKDGHTLWDTEVLKPDPGKVAAMHRKNSPASATPIVTNDRLYVHFGHMGTAALDLAGQVLWRQTDLPYAPTHGNGGSPVLLGDELIFSADGHEDPCVIALEAKTGALRWKTPRNSPAKKQFSFSTPLVIEVGGAQEVISPGPGFVGAYDPKDGHEMWRVGYGEGYSVVPRPVYAHGLLYLSSGFDKATFYAIKPAGATGDATATNVAWTLAKGAPHTPSAVVVGDEVYVVSDAGIATCANATTGEVYWSERLGGNFSASPVVVDDRIYFVNESGVGYVVKASKTYELLATNALGEKSLASPAVADGVLYIRTESHLWKIGK